MPRLGLRGGAPLAGPAARLLAGPLRRVSRRGGPRGRQERTGPLRRPGPAPFPAVPRHVPVGRTGADPPHGRSNRMGLIGRFDGGTTGFNWQDPSLYSANASGLEKSASGPDQLPADVGSSRLVASPLIRSAPGDAGSGSLLACANCLGVHPVIALNSPLRWAWS